MLRIVFLVAFVFALSGCATKVYDTTSFFSSSGENRNESISPIKLPTLSTASVVSPRNATMRPYNVLGKEYVPTFVEVGQNVEGIASWYGPTFHGKKTSNGEDYDMHAYTAAHKTFPMNTVVKVMSKTTKKAVVVRINDRGPFVEGRIIDLSFSAGKDIGIDLTGTAPVVLTVLGFDNTVSTVSRGEKRIVSRFMVQIGAFKNRENALRMATNNGKVDGLYGADVKTYGMDEQALHRVMLVGFQSESEARDFIARGKFTGAFVVAE